MNTSDQSSSVWPTNALDQVEDLYVVMRDLRNLSRAFGVTGNETMSNKLYELAAEIDNACGEIRNHIADNVNQRFKDSMESSGNVLAAVLAGSTMARAEQKETK